MLSRLKNRLPIAGNLSLYTTVMAAKTHKSAQFPSWAAWAELSAVPINDEGRAPEAGGGTRSNDVQLL